jgi:hypothetical protein
MIGNEILRDKYGKKIGEVQMNGSKCTLRDKYGNPLGSYYSHDDFTRDLYGNPIGKGNLLVTLLR